MAQYNELESKEDLRSESVDLRDDNLRDDHFHDECGVMGVWNHPDASRLTYLGLYAIQHRGQESAGIVSLHNGEQAAHRGLGLVGDVFTEATLAKLPGHAAIGHVRYSTTGLNFLNNAQPLSAQLLHGPISLAHNGNLVNSSSLRNELKQQGAIFQGTNDTEVLLHLLAREPDGGSCGESFLSGLQHALGKLQGAYSLVMLTKQALFAIRDPWGFRPLVLGKINNIDNHQVAQTTFVVASETCAFDLIGAEFVREIEPGEIFWVDESGTHSVQMNQQSQKQQPQKLARCIFEHVYFARPDSIVFGRSVYESRKQAGRCLAREASVDADVVVPVPDSGVPAAIGYADESGIPFELGIVRNHYIGRTFIQPHQSVRDFGVKIKLNPQAAILKDKRVVVVDDSLVRGTTSRKIVSLVRQAGAREVHLRIAAPPTIGPCYYGVDTPEKSQLIASKNNLEQIRTFVGADSLAYLSLDGLEESVGQVGGFCRACFDGRYPIEP